MSILNITVINMNKRWIKRSVGIFIMSTVVAFIFGSVNYANNESIIAGVCTGYGICALFIMLISGVHLTFD
jgi:hypothetical protein